MAWGSVNVPGGSVQGADGKSAYELAVENGYSGTLEQWLASLKGEEGEPGAAGATGAPGADGPAGPAGPGLPAGGTAGQVPVKVDGADFNTQWKTLNYSNVGAAAYSHSHGTYLNKENPEFRGRLKAVNAVDGIGPCLNIMASYGCSPAPGNIIGGNASYTNNNRGLVLGGNANMADNVAAIEVESYTRDAAAGTITLSVIGKDHSNREHQFWSVLEKADGFGYSGVTLICGDSCNETTAVNCSIKSFDKSTSTIVLNCNFERDVKYVILRADGKYAYAGNGLGGLCMGGTIVYTMNQSPDVVLGYGNFVRGNGVILIGNGLFIDRGKSNVYSGSSHYSEYLTVFGNYNKKDFNKSSDVLIVGGGNSKTARANCFRITKTGTYANGNYNATGADYAEQFEWADGNPNGEDRIGLFVTLEGEKIRLAGPEDDFILGIVSGNPSVIGDSYDDQWQGMYATDLFGRFVWEDILVPAEYDEDGVLIAEEHMETRLKVNPAYDANEKYIPRSERKEWATIGMMGKLTVIDNGDCQVNGWCTAGQDGKAVRSETRTRYRVMARLDETHIRVLIL